MVAEVVTQLQQFHPNVDITCIALTSGKKSMLARGVQSYGFSDFSHLFPKDALEFGQMLVEENFNPSSGITREESIAYLGLSYWDLVQKYGFEEAKTRYSQLRRHSFMPTLVMEKIFDIVSPHVVITTNSPRSELAAIRVANQRGIPSISLVDLFGWKHFCPMEAQHIVVQAEQTILNMISRGESFEHQKYHVLGNPSFDKAIKHNATCRSAWLAKNFPSISLSRPIITWMDTPAYWEPNGWLHKRTSEDISLQLDKVYAAASQNGLQLFIRPHPSQQVSFYEMWIKEKGMPTDIALAYDCDLYDLITSSDFCFGLTSTTLLEALYLDCKVALLCRNNQDERALPLVSLGLAWQVNDSHDLSTDLRAMVLEKDRWLNFSLNRLNQLSTELASPKIAALIYSEAEKQLSNLDQ
ncbi:hypothetical protein [Endozoicomonas ascidiicola]|uniref:hypothetical protein n=1 Tax=Endozoicomonas ascidiicola TaxID=1698521 RepID=UPI000ABFC7E3|nr:hypothetical protein [Endozoicomonas ascidiicola]